MRETLPIEPMNALHPVCEACDHEMSLVAQTRGEQYQQQNGQLFECQKCRMPEVVFA